MQARNLSKVGQRVHKELDFGFDGSKKNSRVIRVEGRPDRHGVTKRVQLSLGSSLLENMVQRIDRQNKKKGG